MHALDAVQVMGGIADYSGSLVLQMPIAEAACVALQLRPERTSVRVVSFGAAAGGRAPLFEIELAELRTASGAPTPLAASGGPSDRGARADAAVPAPSTTSLESELAAVRRARRRGDAVVAPAPAPVRPRPARLDADDPRPAMVRQAIARRPQSPRRPAMAGDLLAGLQAAARRRA